MVRVMFNDEDKTLEYILGNPTNEAIFKNCFKPIFSDEIEFENIAVVYDLDTFIYQKIRELLESKEAISSDDVISLYKKFKIPKRVLNNLLSQFDIEDDRDLKVAMDIVEELKNIIFLREMALLVYFRWKRASTSIFCTQLANIKYARLSARIDYENQYNANESSMKTKIAQQRWGNRVEEQKAFYLSLYKKRCQELNKKLAATSVAEWIASHHNNYKISYERILELLREAVRENKK